MKTIVIDPGHGGWDVGAPATDNGRECDFNLALAFAVRDELARYEVGVILTRQADVGLSPRGNLAEELGRRAQIANAAGADLLISLHHDSTGKQEVRGASLWVWTDKLNEKKGLTWLPATGNHKDPRSIPIARSMVGALRSTLGALGVPWRWWADPDGIACANFGVLSNTRGPAVLLECFHGSNPEDVAAARRPEFIPTLARAIADAIAGALSLPAVVQPGDDLPVHVNGRPVRMRARLEEGTTRADLRPMAEALGAVVNWVPPEQGGPRVDVLKR